MHQELVTMATAALPISELRGAIPLALGFGFSAVKAYLISVAGNAAVVVPLLLFLKYGSAAAARAPVFARILGWVFDRTRKKHGPVFQRASSSALFVFVAIPLPLTGAWTACVIAFLFNLPFWKSVYAILLGVLVSGAIVVFLTYGLGQLL